MSDDKAQNSKMSSSSLFAEGEWMFGKRKYENAVNRFTEALALSPGDKNCLVGRAKCYMKLEQPEKALKDAEASLKDDETFSEGLYLKAEALFFMREFEFALIFYSRGFAICPHNKFRLGMQKSQEAIADAIGNPSTFELTSAGDLSFLLEELAREQPITAIQDLTEEKRHDSPKAHKNKKTSKQLPGKFYDDKKFLEDLMKDEDLVKGVTMRGEPVQDIIEGCIASLENLEILSLEKPASLQKNEPSTYSAGMYKPSEAADSLKKEEET